MPLVAILQNPMKYRHFYDRVKGTSSTTVIVTRLLQASRSDVTLHHMAQSKCNTFWMKTMNATY